MVVFENHLGTINLSHEFITKLIASTIIKCFGVCKISNQDLTKPLTLSKLIKKQHDIKSGIKIKYLSNNNKNDMRYFYSDIQTKNVKNYSDSSCVDNEQPKIIIDIHISVMYGSNIKSVVQNIASKINFTVNDITGISIEKINIFVDEIIYKV